MTKLLSALGIELGSHCVPEIVCCSHQFDMLFHIHVYQCPHSDVTYERNKK